jgi:hypothetical protein
MQPARNTRWQIMTERIGLLTFQGSYRFDRRGSRSQG